MKIMKVYENYMKSIPVSINKVLLECGQNDSFTYCL